MVSGPPGFALTLMVAGSAAVLMLIVVKLWPEDNDTLERLGAKVLRGWDRFAGADHPPPRKE